MLQTWLILSTLLAPQTPDLAISPGDVCTDLSLDFKEYRYEEQIPYCVRNVSVQTKAYVYKEYDVNIAATGEYTIDHIIPLAIGGSNDVSNLWPEHRAIKSGRQNLEHCLYMNMKEGVISQKEAIATVLDAKFHRTKGITCVRGLTSSSP